MGREEYLLEFISIIEDYPMFSLMENNFIRDCDMNDVEIVYSIDSLDKDSNNLIINISKLNNTFFEPETDIRLVLSNRVCYYQEYRRDIYYNGIKLKAENLFEECEYYLKSEIRNSKIESIVENS